MIVTGWSNGSPNNRTGAGYGLKLSHADRDAAFDPSWGSVTLQFPEGETISIRLSPSFWRNCSELRSSVIGRWLLRHGLAPWRRGYPPQLSLTPMGPRRFRLSR